MRSSPLQHRGIAAHPVKLTGENLHLLEGITFAFISMDAGEAKKLIVERLHATFGHLTGVGLDRPGPVKK